LVEDGVLVIAELLLVVPFFLDLVEAFNEQGLGYRMLADRQLGH